MCRRRPPRLTRNGDVTGGFAEGQAQHRRAHLFNPSDEAAEPWEALPERFHARLSIAFSVKGAAEHCDAADDFAQFGGFLGWGLFGQQPDDLPFNLVKHFAGE